VSIAGAEDPVRPCQKDGHEGLEAMAHENGARRIVIRRGPLIIEG
jgi:hypothetical protein